MCKAALLWLYFFLFSSTVIAVERLELSIGQSQWPQGLLEQLDLSLQFHQHKLTLVAKAKRLELNEQIGNLHDVKVTCSNIVLHGQQLGCRQGQLQFFHAIVGQQQIAFELDKTRKGEQLIAHLTGLRLANGQMDVTLRYSEDHWQSDITASEQSLPAIQALLQPYMPIEMNSGASDQITGQIQWQLAIKGDQHGVKTLSAHARVGQMNIISELAALEAQDLGATWAVQGQRHRDQWTWQMTMQLAQGQAYRDPIYMDFSQTPLQMNANGQWQPKTMAWQITQADISQQTVMAVQLSAQGVKERVAEANVKLARSELTALYAHWFQPFMMANSLGNIVLSGHVDLDYQYKNNDYAWQLALFDVDIDDESQRFAFQDLNGQVAWSTGLVERPIELSWSQASVLSIPLGSSHVHAISQSNGLSLQQAWDIPILDGHLGIQQLQLNQSNDGVNWVFEGLISPISMTLLSERLGWPTMHGKLSGVIPKVTYQQRQITVDGALMVKLFQGTSIIHHLRLVEPLGAIPQLYADIDLQHFDLETMTNTFDFGTMTGTVSGKINQLRLANWEPVAFDAYLSTPENDPVSHKISQQAVNNLSSLGGGVSDVLSRSVLRFFEDFSYQKIGIGCRLRNAVCQMSGVEAAEQGYYIVKGGGFPPTINVIGHTEQVDWPELLTRLKAVSNSAGPVVQ